MDARVVLIVWMVRQHRRTSIRFIILSRSSRGTGHFSSSVFVHIYIFSLEWGDERKWGRYERVTCRERCRKGVGHGLNHA